MSSILIAGGEAGIRQAIAAVLAEDGHKVTQAEDGRQAMGLLHERVYHLVVTDIKMNGAAGLEMLDYIQENFPHTPVIVIGNESSPPLTAKAKSRGAYDVLEKPLDYEHFRTTARRAMEKSLLHHAVDYLRHEQPYIYRLNDVLAESPLMKRVIDQVIRVAPSDATVMLTGESGTGKSLIAGSIHANSPRRARTLVTVNCAALPETLLESELFGHEKGAFTGAHKSRAGRIQQAHGGTLFLDEVGDMAAATQAKLLRAIEEKVIIRVGGSREIQVDVRILAATNQDLPTAVEEGRFREDLFYRLNVATIELPPLRERVEDILPLAERFMARLCGDLKRPPLAISEAARDAMEAHSWPGNIRELRNAVERALLFANGPEVMPADLGLKPPSKTPQASYTAENLNLDNLEKWAIMAALEQSDWVQSRAARLLGISARGLVYKIKKHQITHPELDARRRRR